MVSLPPTRTTELHYNGQWNTVPVLERSSITISRGVSSEGSRATPTKASGVLVDNRSGDYAPRNPNSPLYGAIGRNTPLRFSIDAGSPWLALTASTAKLTTPDNAQLAITGDVDVRCDVALDDWRTAQDLAGRYVTTGDQRSWALILTSDGHPALLWSPNGTLASRIVATGTEPVPVHAGQRVCLRATVDVDNGAGGYDVAFYYGLTVDDTNWVQIGATLTGSGTTSVHDGTAGVEVGDMAGLADPGMVGRVYALKVTGGGATVIDVDLGRDAAVGAGTVTDAEGLVWTLTGGAELTNRHTRLVGEVPAWPPSRDLSGQDRTVAIEPTGIMRRLGAGNKPLDSALRRYLAASTAAECWPLTDGPESTQAASLLGGQNLVYSHESDDDPPEWAQGKVADWLEPVVKLPGVGKLIGSLPYLASMETGWAVDHVRSGPGEIDQIHMYDWGAGTDAENRISFQLLFQAGTFDKILIFWESAGISSSSGGSLGTIESPGIYDGRPHHIRFRALPIGPDVFWYVIIDGVVAASGDTPLTIKPLRRVEYWWGANDEDLSLGYITCWPEDPVPPEAFEVYDAMFGFSGETAGERALRVAGEQGVPLTVAGVLDEQTRLGTQHPERFLEVLNTAAKADLGYVLEQRDDRALVYRGRSTLYNQTPVLTLDWADGIIAEPFAPTDDDKDTQNDVTVERQGGSKGFAVLTEGSMSIQDPPDGVGRYDRAHTLSLKDDDQAPQHAYWRMHLGTFDGLRYTKLTLDLANPRVYALIDQIMRADVGHLIRLVNLPAEYGPDDVDLIIRGYDETVSATKWQITFNCSPGEPWQVAVVDEDGADTAGSELAAAVDADDTSLSVVTTAGSPWVTSTEHPTDFPFDVRVGGEVMTATALTSAALDTFDRSVTDGWGTAPVGGTWQLSPLANSDDFDVAGGIGTIGIDALNTTRRAYLPSTFTLTDASAVMAFSSPVLAANGNIECSIMLRVDPSNIGNTYYYGEIELNYQASRSVRTRLMRRQNAVDTELAAAIDVPGLTYTAGAIIWCRFEIEGDQLRLRAWADGKAEPNVWHREATDTTLTSGRVGVRTILDPGNTNPLPVVLSVRSFEITSPQTFTVTRAVNGISKSHAAGADIRLAQPATVAL